MKFSKYLAIIAVVLCFCLSFSCTAEGFFTFQTVAPKQPEERLEVYRIPVDAYLSDIMLRAYDANNTLVGDTLLTSYSSEGMAYTDFTLDIHRLPTGLYYVESMYVSDGISYTYEILSLDDAGFTRVQSVYDPGYSDGFGIYNALTDEVLYESNYSSDYAHHTAEIDAVLNDTFGKYGITFADRAAASVSGTLVQHLGENDVFFLPIETRITPTPEPEFTEVYTTGDVHVRTGPGLSYGKLGVVKKGNSVSYLNEISTDERGVDWYKVDFKGETGWMSSKYSTLR